MNERRNPPDPSMEEILASIRRIISDDGPRPNPPPATAASPASDEPVVAMPLSPRPDVEPAPPPAREREPAPMREDVLELTQVLREDGAVVNILRPEQPAPDERPLYRPRIVAEAEREVVANLVSADVAAEAAAAIAAIGRVEAAGGADAGQRATGGDRGTGGGRTVEDLVRDLLRPMLKEWLDARLPGLVETVVREEIERIVRRSNLR